MGAGCGGKAVRGGCRTIWGNGRFELAQAESKFVKLFAGGKQGVVMTAGGLERLWLLMLGKGGF